MDVVLGLSPHAGWSIAVAPGVEPAPVAAEPPRILAAHPSAHAAEGELFRRALADAAQLQGLAVLEVPRRDLYEHAAGMLRRTKAELAATLADLGKGVGPPWRRDEKEATLVAWLAVASAPTD